MNDTNSHSIDITASSGNIVIRNYVPADYSGLFRLLSVVYGSRISQTDLEAHYLGDCADILIAAIDNTVVGCSFLNYQTDYVRESHIVFVTYVAVDDAFRHQGIGTLMFQEIEKRALQNGCSAIELTSADSRVSAHAFYHSLQFTKKKTTVFIKEI